MVLVYRAFGGDYPWPNDLVWNSLSAKLDSFQSWLLDQRSAEDESAFFSIFNAFATLVDNLVDWFTRFLLWLSWLGVAAVGTITVLRFGGRRAAGITLAAFASFALVGLWEASMETLALMLAAVGLSLLPSVVALRAGEVAQYHGVEHKAIAAYEQGIDDPAGVPKEHDRCGSNLIAPLLAFSIAGQVIIERLIENPGRLARGASALASLSLAVETFVYAERNPDSAFGRALHRSGYEIQRVLATREPTPEQLEVARAAGVGPWVVYALANENT